jgi:hypothetical protein
MSKGSWTFKPSDVMRAIKAAKAAGIENPQVVIDLEHKRMTITPVKANQADGIAENEWDQVLSDDQIAEVR